MDIQQYLSRIHYHGDLDINPDTLADLQRCHLRSVPFESLDIFLNYGIELDLERIYDKVIKRGRGGFCYELNGLFCWLLENTGFEVTRLSGRVMSDQNQGREFAHMLLMVKLQETWVADVGFGDSFIEPLKLLANQVQKQQTGTYRLLENENTLILQQESDTDWEDKYQFSLTPRSYSEFSEMCIYQQTNPDSYFAHAPICTILTLQGRITLSGKRLILTEGDKRDEKTIESVPQYQEFLQHHFGIILDIDEVAKLYQADFFK